MKRYSIWILFSFLFLNGCGFHLRGIQEMPTWLQDVTVVVKQADNAWESILYNQLRASHVSIVNDPTQARYWLIIEKEFQKENIVSISSGSSPRQYQLIYTVQFSLQRAKGEEAIPVTSIIVTRALTVNNDRILGSNDEAEKLIQEMRKDAAIQIIYRLGSK